jgi:hypothetical protein
MQHRKLLIMSALLFILLVSSVHLIWRTQQDTEQEAAVLKSLSDSIALLETVREVQGKPEMNPEELIKNITGQQLAEHAASCENTEVTDVQNHPFKSDIEALLKNCIVNGYTDNTFRPDTKINRAELSKVVMGAFFSEEELQSALDFFLEQGSGYAGLPDVPVDQWYAPYVALGILENIIKGYMGEIIEVGDVKDHPFKPGNPVTFGEAFKILLSAKIAVTDDTTRQKIENELFYAASDTTSLPEVPLDDWTRPYVIAGSGKNLDFMYPTSFIALRHTQITRAQFAHLAVNVMSY